MNRIVREHYPVANLPEDLRVGLDADAKVKIVLEVEPTSSLIDDLVSADGTIKAENLMEVRRRLLARGRPSVSADEAVARIRALRDEWDD